MIRDVGRWMGENQEKVRKFSDVVAISTLAIGIGTVLLMRRARGFVR